MQDTLKFMHQHSEQQCMNPPSLSLSAVSLVFFHCLFVHMPVSFSLSILILSLSLCAVSLVFFHCLSVHASLFFSLSLHINSLSLYAISLVFFHCLSVHMPVCFSLSTLWDTGMRTHTQVICVHTSMHNTENPIHIRWLTLKFLLSFSGLPHIETSSASPLLQRR